MKIIEKFVAKHGRVYRSDCNPNPLISTTYCTVGLGDDLTCYSVIGQHSNCTRLWIDEQTPVPYSELTEDERQILTQECMGQINPLYPRDIHYHKLIEDFVNNPQSVGVWCWSCGLQNRIRHNHLKLYWLHSNNEDICSARYCKSCYEKLLTQGEVYKTFEEMYLIHG